MGDDLLLLDSLQFGAGAEYMSEFLGCPVKWVDTVELATQELSNTCYAALLVEPLLYWNRNPDPLLDFLQQVRDQHSIPVIVHTSKTEQWLKDERVLQSGVHYDAYVRKGSSGCARLMKGTLATLLSQ